MMLGPICAFFSSITWTMGSAGYSKLSGTYSAFSISFMRAAFALPLFFVWACISTGSPSALLAAYHQVSISSVEWFALSMFTSYGFGDVLFLWSTRHIGIPSALALASSYPVWTAVAGLFMRGEHLSMLQVCGLFMTVAGMVTVILNSPALKPSLEDSSHGRSHFKGVIFGFIASLLWALNSVSVAQAGLQISSLPVANTIRMGIGFLMSAAFCKILTPRSPVLLPRSVIRNYAWLFGIEAFGGSAFYTYGMTHSTLAVGATLSSLSPVISVPVAWVMGLEKFSIYRTLGVCFVVLGVAFLMGGGRF